MPAIGRHETRVDWIDVARGIGILLVVYGHAIRGRTVAGLYPRTPAILLQDSLIYSFHMPLFFLLSGLFAGRGTRRGVAAFLGTRLTSIIWPYFLWSLLQGSMQVLASHLVNNPLGWSSLIAILWEPIGQFWFLYALLLCQLLLLLPRRIFYLAVPVLLVVRMLGDDGSILFRAMADLPFFAAGVWLGGEGASRLTDGRRALSVVAIGVALFALMFAVRDQMVGGVPHVALRLAIGLGGIATVLGLARMLAPHDRVLRALGAASMPIYLMHVIASAVLRIALGKLHLALPPIGALILVTLVGIVLPYLAWLTAERLGLSPWLGFGRARGTIPPSTPVREAELP